MAINDKTKDLTGKILAAGLKFEQGEFANKEAAVAAAWGEFGVDNKELERRSDELHSVIASIINASGTCAKAQFEANPEIKTVAGEFKLGRDILHVAIDREREVRDPGTGETRTVYGASTVNFVVTGARNIGQIKKVRDEWKQQITESVGK